MKREFTLHTAKLAKENNSLREWSVGFLGADGKNNQLAKHLDEHGDLWIDLIEFPIKMLRREMGTKEEGLVFSEDKEIWDKRIESFVKDIQEGYIPCPLIATDFWGDIHLSDGAHRHEALLQAGISKYWTIFFIKHSENKKWVLDNIHHTS
jgi:hypothetical protein